MKSGQTDLIGWKHFCWPELLNLPSNQMFKVTPTHPPPASAAQSTEPFIKPVQPVPASTEFPGSGFSAVKHQPTSQTENN